LSATIEHLKFELCGCLFVCCLGMRIHKAFLPFTNIYPHVAVKLRDFKQLFVCLFRLFFYMVVTASGSQLNTSYCLLCCFRTKAKGPL